MVAQLKFLKKMKLKLIIHSKMAVMENIVMRLNLNMIILLRHSHPS